jgi:hypothetical protein
MQMPVMAKGVFMARFMALRAFSVKAQKIGAEMPECEPIGSSFVGYQDFVKHSGALFDGRDRIHSNLPRIRLNPERSAPLPASKQEEDKCRVQGKSDENPPSRNRLKRSSRNTAPSASPRCRRL